MDNEHIPPILTIEQAADYLQLAVEELRVELEKGHIPGLKVADKWRIKRDVLERLLDTATTLHGQGAPATTPPAVLGSEDIRAAESVESNIKRATTAEDGASEAVQPFTQEEPPAVKEPTATYLAQGPTPPLPAQPPPHIIPSLPGRVRGRVFSYNRAGGFGYARLPDNRVVWLDSKCLAERLPTPFPGDIVEFELEHNRNGLVARSIKIIPKGDGHAASKSTEIGMALPSAKPQPELPTAPETPSPSVIRTLKTPVTLEGTPQSQRLYQKAALARTEGRYEDARRLFRQAIRAGAGTQVYSAFFKMELEKGTIPEARRIIQEAIEQFPNHATFYEMYGQMERRARNHSLAERIFREGQARFPSDVQLKKGLAQTLVQIGTESSLREAGEVFNWLERRGKLNKDDGLYQRFKALQRSPRANRAYDFFQIAGMRVGIAGRRDLPWYITDIVAETNSQELSESFGLSGAILVRCFHRPASQIDVVNLSKFLRGLGPQGVLGLQDREVVLNPSLAFVAVPNSDAVRDQVMSILSDNNEAIVPLDDTIFQSGESPLKTLRDLLGQYLGLRDLYSSTLPVSGRRFFGRERLLLQLTDEVHHGQFLGIYGLRKMGKTSLIYQLRDEKLRGEAVAYVDLQASAALTMKDCAPLYWELERDLYLRLRERNKEAAELLRMGKVERFSDLPEGGTRAGLLFAEDLRAFLDTLSAGKMLSIKHLVIVLDELERILPVAEQRGINGYVEFFGLLRGLAQTERYRGLLSSVVVAANATISERGYWEGRENPVFALYKPVFLPPLSDHECEEMIRTLGKGMSVYWEDKAIEAVFTETGGHPFLTRSLCSRITKQYPARPLTVMTEMVQEQISHFIRDESDKLEQITELLRTNFPQEETILEQIALDETPAELTDESLRHLLGYRLIATNGVGYHVTLNLLRRWLRRRAGIKE